MSKSEVYSWRVDPGLKQRLEEAAERFVRADAQRWNARRGQRAEQPKQRLKRYTEGKKLVEAVFAKGGAAMVRRLFENSPKSPAVLLNPELYFAMQTLPVGGGE